MSLRYKISLLVIFTVFVVLIPLSLIHIHTLAQVEEEEIQGRLQAVGKLVATELFTNELGAESIARQFMFLQSAQNNDDAILFTAIYKIGEKQGLAVINKIHFPNYTQGSEWEVIRKFVEQKADPNVHYVTVDLSQNRKLLMGYSIAEIGKKRQERQLQAILWAIGLSILSLIVSIFFAQWLTRPIRELASGMARVAKGDLNVRLKLRSKDEIGSLTKNFNQMVIDLHENVIERQRMSHELDVARIIQKRLLPQSEPIMKGLDVAGICLTYAEVGGDYYDYLPISDEKLGIVIGDVAGHGVSSGLLAAAVQGCLRNQVSINPDAEKVIGSANRIVYQSAKQMMTLCYAVIDVNNAIADIASAGHWAPYHYMADTGELEEAYPSDSISPALGTFHIDSYPIHQVSLKSGDMLIFYSDGVIETLNPKNEMFGETRFREAISKYSDQNAKNIRDSIIQNLNQFRDKAPQEDDIALVVIKYAS